MNYFKILAIYFVRFYQRFLSPWLGGGCRFAPTCSQFALEALEVYAPSRALWLIGKRVFSCHPFHPGGFDPVRPQL